MPTKKQFLEIILKNYVGGSRHVEKVLKVARLGRDALRFGKRGDQQSL